MNLTTKDLKKQLFAAIAMVTVAGIALGSSTYAWFVTNNNVKATVSTISAKSNAAFLNIKYNASAKDSDLTADKAELASTALYPAMWSNHVFDESGTVQFEEGILKTGTTYQFETATATTPNSATGKDETIKKTGNLETTVNDGYAVKNTFYINAKATSFKDLKVSGASIATDAAGNETLDEALRVLVVCGDNWVLCNKAGIQLCSGASGTSDANWGYLNDSVTAGTDVQVDMYVFYYGGAAKIYTNNLSALQAASKNITVDFTATAVESTN